MPVDDVGHPVARPHPGQRAALGRPAVGHLLQLEAHVLHQLVDLVVVEPPAAVPDDAPHRAADRRAVTLVERDGGGLVAGSHAPHDRDQTGAVGLPIAGVALFVALFVALYDALFVALFVMPIHLVRSSSTRGAHRPDCAPSACRGGVTKYMRVICGCRGPGARTTAMPLPYATAVTPAVAAERVASTWGPRMCRPADPLVTGASFDRTWASMGVCVQWTRGM
jgi:hypothetical protein